MGLAAACTSYVIYSINEQWPYISFQTIIYRKTFGQTFCSPLQRAGYASSLAERHAVKQIEPTLFALQGFGSYCTHDPCLPLPPEQSWHHWPGHGQRRPFASASALTCSFASACAEKVESNAAFVVCSTTLPYSYLWRISWLLGSACLGAGIVKYSD
jgi:hypothetical protein